MKTTVRIALLSISLSSTGAFAEDLHGLTKAQCEEKHGRVADYDDGCTDKEISLGRVVFMKCPCSCCVVAPAKAVQKDAPSVSLRKIPQANRSLFKDIHDARDWMNPFLMVGGNDVKILHRPSVPTAKLISKLANLPAEAWPYGRIVAVQKNPNSFEDGEAKIKKNMAEVIKRLKELGIEVELWPSA